MKSQLNHRVPFCCLLPLVQLGFAQEASFRTTLLRPVQELRAEALKAQPLPVQGQFREPELVELLRLVRHQDFLGCQRPTTRKSSSAIQQRVSKHNRGRAVDLSLYDLETGKEVKMPVDTTK